MEENTRSEEVPLPGVSESLHVELYLGGVPVATPPPAPGQLAAPVLPAPPPEAALVCSVSQHGRHQIYRAATRYGRGWKWGAGCPSCSRVG